jgi:predicted dehydrogenase
MSSSAQAAPVRIVLIGAGLIGKRHAKHLHEEPEADFVAIAEPFPAGQTVADQYGVKLFKTVDDLVSSETEYDAVLIATPNDSHVPLGVRFLELGKHVLVEKPIANTVEEGRKLVQAAAKSKGKVLVSHPEQANKNKHHI